MIRHEYKILYEDQNIIAVDKPEGLASISENDLSIETLHSSLTKKYKSKIFIVHRIDKEISGIILFAKNSKAHKFMNEQFSKREVEKIYLALVVGNVEKKNDVIKSPIREFGSGKMGIDLIKGKKSTTLYEIVKRFSGHTLLKVNLVTGRRHQIRVHLYSIGHPIAGDLRYGNKENQSKYSRLMLHSHKIAFRNINNQMIEIMSELPESIQTFLKQIEIHHNEK
jgi:RluA family pseudouridine synthase